MYQDSTVSQTANSTVRNIQVRDDTSTIQVALWNAAASSPVKSGDRIKITHTSPKHNKFLKTLALNTTIHSTIEVKGTFSKRCVVLSSEW